MSQTFTIEAWLAHRPAHDKQTNPQGRVEVQLDLRHHVDVDRILGGTDDFESRFTFEVEPNGLVLRRLPREPRDAWRKGVTFAIPKRPRKDGSRRMFATRGAHLLSGLYQWPKEFGSSLTKCEIHTDSQAIFIPLPTVLQPVKKKGNGKKAVRVKAPERELDLSPQGGFVLTGAEVQAKAEGAVQSVDTTRILSPNAVPSHATPGVRLAKAAHIGGNSGDPDTTKQTTSVEPLDRSLAEDVVLNLGSVRGVGSNIPEWVLWLCVDLCESHGYPIELTRNTKPERGDDAATSPTA